VDCLHYLDADLRRVPVVVENRNSPHHSSESVQVREYADNMPWSARNLAVAQRGDPRLRPDAGSLYSKSAAPSGQSVVSVPPLNIDAAQPANWATGSETVQPSTSAQQLTVTPGMHLVFLLLLLSLSLSFPTRWCAVVSFSF